MGFAGELRLDGILRSLPLAAAVYLPGLYFPAECVEKIYSSQFAVSRSRQSFHLGPLAPPTGPSWSRRGVY
jgi:hypothetical protein